MQTVVELLALIVTLAGASFTLVLLTYTVRRYPGVGFLVAALALLALWEYPLLPSVASLGDIAIYPPDIATVVFAAATLPGINSVGSHLKSNRPVLVLLMLTVCFNVVRGVSEFGLSAAANEARELITLCVMTAWVLSQIDDGNFAKRLDRFVRWTSAGLVIVFVCHVAVRGFGTASELIQDGNQYFTSRPLVSSQALFLALASLYLLDRRRNLVLAFTSIVAMLLSQHRSVWISFAVGLAILGLRAAPAIRARLVGIGVLLIFPVIIAVGFNLASSVVRDVHSSLTSSATYSDRVFGWRTLIDASMDKGGSSIALGSPFGAGWTRRGESGLILLSEPHNWFVTMYLRSGLVGIGLIIVAAAFALRQCMRLGGALAMAWLTAIIVFAVPYNLQWHVAPFLALALAGNVPQIRDERPKAANSSDGARRARTHRRIAA